MRLNCEDLNRIADVRVYVNDVLESSVYNNGRIYFPSRGISNRRIFLDCYGFAELSITLILVDGQECTLNSEYLPILVRREELNNSVEAMARFVYNNQEWLLLNGELKPKKPSGLKENGYRSLATQILLAEEIAAIYESSYGYFKANTTSNNYPLDKNGYAIPILFDAINFGSNKAIPADSPTASPEDVMNNVLPAFCSNSSDITISQQEYTNNTDSPEKAMSVPALPPVSCAPTQQVAVSIPQNQPAPTETAVCPPVIERPKAANAAAIAKRIASTGKIRIYQEHIYWYENGWYHLLQTGELRRLMRSLCTADIEKHSSKRVFEDIEVFLLSNSELLAEPPGNHSLLCIQNGIYDMVSNTISPHTPACFFTHCLNVSLPTLCHGTPHFDNFIGFITGNDYALQMRIWQMLGYIFACDTDGKVFFLLQGVSNSGKSVLLELLRSMFNPEAVSTLDLYRLGDRFSGAALIEKKLNICGDLPNRTLSAQAVATLKQITGRDLMTVEEKYKPLATMAPAINLVFASNFPIRMAEEDTALLSRMVVIPFRFSIPTEQQDHLLTQKILAERDGIFLRAIHAYHRLLADKYIFAGQALVDQLLSQSYASPMSENQNIAAFLNDCCILTDDNSFTSTQDLHEACTAYCVGHDLPIITDRTRFSRILRSQLANKVKPKKIRIGDKTHNGYIGIKLSNQ